MSFYTSAIKTHHVDPYYNSSKNRTEFRLDADKMFLSNLRLLNVGVVAGTTDRDLNYLVGPAGVIRRIGLYDGNQFLSGSNHANLWMSFKNQLSTNRVMKNVDRYTKQLNLGFIHQIDASAAANERATFLSSEGVFQVTDNEDTTPLVHLDLKELIPMLGATRHLPSNVFRRLRLVIEYETDPLLVVINNTIASTVQPLLVVDELVSDKAISDAMSSMGDIQWMEIEHDNAYLPAGTAVANTPAVQTANFRLNGFDNKYVDRMVIMFNSDGTETNVNGAVDKYESVVQDQERLQISVNGSNLLPFNGIEYPNQKLARLTDSWGDVCMTPSANKIWSPDMDVYDVNTEELTGTLGHTGVVVGQRVGELQLQYKRNCHTAAAPGALEREDTLNASKNINVFAEVLKSIKMSNNGYKVMYN